MAARGAAWRWGCVGGGGGRDVGRVREWRAGGWGGGGGRGGFFGSSTCNMKV